MQWDRESLIASAAQAGLAAVGGLIGGLMRKEDTTVRESIIGALGAGFVGLLVAKFCHGSGMSDDTTFVCVGVAGWLGATRTIDVLQRALSRMPLGMKWDPKSDDANDQPKEDTKP